MGTSQNKTLFNDYEGFVEKFRPKKTTDDCYTPPEVYAAVLDYVRSIADIEGRPIVRPFYPGGDYEHYDYPENCVVVDNPPFSILAKICRDYLARGIDFFLFAPTATLICKLDLCHVLLYEPITYENGASVKTSFRTSLLPGMRLVTAPGLERAIREVNERRAKPAKVLEVLAYPENLLMPMTLSKYAKGGLDLAIRSDECAAVSSLDRHRNLFGSGLLLSDAAAERMAAAERKAEAVRRAKRVELSEREREIVRLLGEGLGE